MSKKGQVSSVDAVMAFVLFFAVLALFWNVRSEVVGKEEYSFREMGFRARMAAHYLVDGAGTPVDWNSSNVLAVGLARRRGVVEEDRLANFLNLSTASPDAAKELLGVAPFSLAFSVSHAGNSSAVFVNRPPVFRGYAAFGNASGDLAISSREPAVFNGNRVIVEVRIAR